MKCPSCGSYNVIVKDSRTCPESVYRRRMCVDCEHRFSTIEIEKVEHEMLVNLANKAKRLRKVIEVLEKVRI